MVFAVAVVSLPLLFLPTFFVFNVLGRDVLDGLCVLEAEVFDHVGLEELRVHVPGEGGLAHGTELVAAAAVVRVAVVMMIVG